MNDKPLEQDSTEHISMFENEPASVLDEFGKLCQGANIQTGIAIILDPSTGKPQAYIIGHLYDATSLGTQILNEFKKTLQEGLN